MEREIKFRAWDGEKLIPLHLDDWTFYEGELCHRQAPLLPVMQYSGEKDKYGNEIYEGDIVDFVFDGVAFISNPYYVVFDKGYFGIKKPNFNPLVSDCENIIIRGNIYENPELLNQGAKDERSVATKDQSR